MMASATASSSGAPVAVRDREAAADVECREVTDLGKDRCGTAYSNLPCARVELLRPDVEAQALGPQPEPSGVLQQPGGLGGRTTELVAERRHRRRKHRSDTTFHARAGRVLGDRRQPVHGVEREPRDPARKRLRHPGRLLDGVPERQKTAVDIGGTARVDLADRGDVELGPLGREQTQDRRGRIRLDRVADPRVGQRGSQCLEVLAHPSQIDPQIRRVRHTSQRNRRLVVRMGGE